MIWLIYGYNGWIGGQIRELLEYYDETCIEGKSRADSYRTTYSEISTIKPDRIVCTLGRTSGPECSNIDYLELPNKLQENMRDNLHAPINLAMISKELGIHMTYIGTGCIYEYDDTHTEENLKGFTENDIPNFKGSQYSAVKGVTDQLISKFSTVLNCRIRMPISEEIHPRNFITKITKYKKVISVPNSMTVLPELLPIMIDMAKNKVTGCVNMTNPDVISHQEILDMYKQYVDPTYQYDLMTYEELSKYTCAQRSNNCLDTSLLTSMYKVVPIKEAVKCVLIKMKLYKETI